MTAAEMTAAKMTVADIMTTSVVTIAGADTVLRAIHLMRDRGVRSLIVDRRHNQDAYGIVTETDIVRKVAAYGKAPGNIRVFEIMTKPCVTVNPDLQVEHLARLFTNFDLRVAPVVTDRLLGIVSVSDILLKSDFAEQPKERIWEQAIQEAIGKARATCTEYGVASSQCMDAWKEVEYLQAEAAHQRSERPNVFALDEYAEEFPEIKEAWMYDAWCSG